MIERNTNNANSFSVFASKQSVTNLTNTVNNLPLSGLVFIKHQNIGTNVSSVTVTNAFSGDFNAYRIILSGGASNSGDYGINMYLGSTRTGYYYTGTYLSYGNTSGWIGSANAAEYGAAGIASTNTLHADIFVNGPNLAKNTFFQNTYIYNYPSGGRAEMAGYLANNTQYTSFTLFMGGSTMTGGVIRVYGYRNYA